MSGSLSIGFSVPAATAALRQRPAPDPTDLPENRRMTEDHKTRITEDGDIRALEN
jgi:hypothetical protein